MKTYMGEGQIRLVGKAWEVRHFMKKALAQAPEGLTLLEYISHSRVTSGSAAMAAGSGSNSHRPRERHAAVLTLVR